MFPPYFLGHISVGCKNLCLGSKSLGSRKNEAAGLKQKQTQLWALLLVKEKSNAVKKYIA